MNVILVFIFNLSKFATLVYFFTRYRFCSKARKYMDTIGSDTAAPLARFPNTETRKPKTDNHTSDDRQPF